MLKPFKTASLQFEQIKEIGQNGKNSKTHICKDYQLNAEIVIKTIEKSKLNSPDEYFNESQILYASEHPYVAKVNYACYDDDNIYIAMPFHKNGSLKELIENQNISNRKIITLSTQILAGLQNIHSKGLIHFDIKPDNILLSDRNEAMISDFGLAKQTDYSGKAEQDRHYGKMLPPEAFSSASFDRTFDIYQFGLTIYRLCNGNEEFNKQFSKYLSSGLLDRNLYKHDVINGKFPDRSIFPAHIPNKIKSIVKKCLQPDISHRYQSAIDIANDLASESIKENNLDWKLKTTSDKRLWTKSYNDAEYTLTVSSDGSCETYKSVNGGKPRRIIEMCKSTITETELRDFFQNT